MSYCFLLTWPVRRNSWTVVLTVEGSTHKLATTSSHVRSSAHTDIPFASEGPPNKHYSDLVHSSFDGYLPFLCLTTPLQCGQHMITHVRAPRSTVFLMQEA